MESADTFTLLPLEMDPQTKSISAPTPTHTLSSELVSLNALHRNIQQLDNPAGVPPPPVPVNPKRSAQVNKLRESGNASFRKGAHADAVRMYSLGIDMALGRPGWEPAGLVRDEVSGLYSNRAQAQMGQQHWAEAAVDAQCSVELKKVGNAKAWWRRGKCLLEMGRLDEAREWVEESLEFENGEADLEALLKEIEAAEKRGK